jgi:hypothetical protein
MAAPLWQQMVGRTPTQTVGILQQPQNAMLRGTMAGVNTGIQGSVLGTTNIPQNTVTNNNPVQQQTQQSIQQPSGPSADDILNQGYSDYTAQLDQMLGNLGVQSGAMNTQAQEAYNQQANNLELQNTQGTNTLNQYQNKSLKDIGSTIANGFKAGNVLLGSMGAGDSSAANQYSYAMAKEGSKQRGAVTADVSARLGNLQQVYNTAKNNLVSGLNQQVQQIAQWYSQQQMQLQGMKADAAKEKSNQTLQIALNQLGVAQQQALNMQNSLNTWVANNATSIQSAQQQIQRNVANNPIPTAMNTTPQSTIASAAPTFWSNNNDTTKKTLFG